MGAPRSAMHPMLYWMQKFMKMLLKFNEILTKYNDGTLAAGSGAPAEHAELRVGSRRTVGAADGAPVGTPDGAGLLSSQSSKNGSKMLSKSRQIFAKFSRNKEILVPRVGVSTA